MDPRMLEWITTGERPLPPHVIGFAKSVSGSSKSKDDDEEEDEDDEEDDEEDDDEDDDEDEFADMSDDELRAELKKAKASLTKAGGSVKSKRAKIRKLTRDLEDAKKPKPAAKKKSGDEDDDAPDLDAIRSQAASEAAAPAILRAKRSEAKIALRDAGINPERIDRALKQLDLDDLELDDDGLDGIEDAIEELKADLPELFASKRRRRQSVAGEGDRDGGSKAKRASKMTPSERQALAATGKR